MNAYDQCYLDDAMKNLGGMLDYAVNDCGFAAGEILEMFIISGKAEVLPSGYALDTFGIGKECIRIGDMYIFTDDIAKIEIPGDEKKRIDPSCFDDLAGELLDVDGRCGGYNLQWAMTSGLLAGRSAARYLQFDNR